MKLIEIIKKKWFCCHEWEKLYTSVVYHHEEDKMPYKSEMTLVCKKCGKIKKINV